MMAQPTASWSVHDTSDSNFVNFGSNKFMTIDGINTRPQVNDAIGIFTLVKNLEKCVGYTIITDSASFRITIYKSTPTDSLGYTPKSSFRIRWWKSTENCEVIFQNSGRLDTLQISVSKVSANLPTISYSPTYNKTDINPNPSLVGISIADLKFYTISPILSLDTMSGIINLNNSTPSNYTINFSSQYCLSNNSFNITITDSIPPIIDTTKAPILTNLAFDLLSPGCKTLGSIYFKENSIKGKKPFIFQLSTNYSLDVITNSNGKFDELREGNYQLTVRDSTGKETKYEKTISLIKQGDCTSSVLAPNSKDGLQAIFIPETGTANILNRDGAVIKRLTIPAEWDGRDSNGSDVPMGDYYLFINEHQSKIITVIR